MLRNGDIVCGISRLVDGIRTATFAMMGSMKAHGNQKLTCNLVSCHKQCP